MNYFLEILNCSRRRLATFTTDEGWGFTMTVTKLATIEVCGETEGGQCVEEEGSNKIWWHRFGHVEFAGDVGGG